MVVVMAEYVRILKEDILFQVKFSVETGESH